MLPPFFEIGRQQDEAAQDCTDSRSAHGLSAHRIEVSFCFRVQISRKKDRTDTHELLRYLRNRGRFHAVVALEISPQGCQYRHPQKHPGYRLQNRFQVRVPHQQCQLTGKTIDAHEQDEAEDPKYDQAALQQHSAGPVIRRFRNHLGKKYRKA
ncbi:hypothetical protein SDC9_147132 [bioreactor metagenome]|uniref:Uncharacterized protein n=1 Tax=bioreactor metagenome TaxID=1076179 RepID=A0A645ED88_9ZZZZ